MTLTLSMLRCPDAVAPESRTLQSGEFSIGRGPENDWVLPDPERSISKRHCILAYRAGYWQVADLSTNGTFLNRDSEPLGRGQPHDLRDGDRLRIGPYEIEVRVVETAAPLRSPVASQNPFDLDPFANPPAGAAAARFEPDPLLRPAGAPDPFGSSIGQPGVTLPPDYDPLAPDTPDVAFAGPVVADHSPHIDDAFIPPVARPVLPDDWDREFHSFAAAPTAPEATPPAAPTPALAPSPIAAPFAPAPTAAPEPFASPPPVAPAASVGTDLLAAFLHGTGISDTRPAGDPAAAMEGFGRAFRVLVSGLRQALIARAAVKREFRLEQTSLRSLRNNPLKFSADDEDALRALLGAGRRTDMNAAEAVADALRDVRLHELATVVAMQSAVRALLAELEPDKLRRTVERGRLDLVPMQRKAGAWDAFEALYARITHALSDDFDSVFGKNFARAYERALAEASAKDQDA